ncbi:MAG TPA: glycosyltransferase family 4 protein [Verrucomicrobia bacterium]|nr:glycosyltransferase family 4 protein [Verrucomicrobiota bacterium]HPU56956.1 glycosyltransferase [Verrucomicrobiota bacterium]
MHVTICYLSKRPVPPPLYGGGQRAMYWLGKALIELGHKVTLIAQPGSHIPGAELRPWPKPHGSDYGWMRLIPDSTDILHLRSVPLVPMPKPYVLTIGGNGEPGQQFPPNTIFLSRSHAALHGSTHFVYNGIDPAEYRCESERGDYAVFLAKASWDVKNLPGAIEVCRRAGVELYVIGSRNWPFGLQRRLPVIRGVRYLGMLGQAEKIPLLARARCLVFPVRWHEPFGIAVVEALASGCYVAATPYGALPELVTVETGVLSRRASDLADAVRHPERFDPSACVRRVTEGGFTHIDMARRYLRYYEQVLCHGELENNGQLPQTAAGFDANKLLEWHCGKS